MIFALYGCKDVACHRDSIVLLNTVKFVDSFSVF